MIIIIIIIIMIIEYTMSYVNRYLRRRLEQSYSTFFGVADVYILLHVHPYQSLVLGHYLSKNHRGSTVHTVHVFSQTLTSPYYSLDVVQFFFGGLVHPSGSRRFLFFVFQSRFPLTSDDVKGGVDFVRSSTTTKRIKKVERFLVRSHASTRYD